MSYALINARSDSRPEYRSPYQKTSSLFVKNEAFAVLSPLSPPTSNTYRNPPSINSQRESSFVILRHSYGKPSPSGGVNSLQDHGFKSSFCNEKPRLSRSRLPVVQRKASVVRPISKSVSPIRSSATSGIPRPMANRGTSRSTADMAKNSAPLTSSENLPPKRPVSECDLRKSTPKLSPPAKSTPRSSSLRSNFPEVSVKSNPALSIKQIPESLKKRDYSADGGTRMVKTTSKTSSLTRSKENLSPCSRIPTAMKTAVNRKSPKAVTVSPAKFSTKTVPKSISSVNQGVPLPENCCKKQTTSDARKEVTVEDLSRTVQSTAAKDEIEPEKDKTDTSSASSKNLEISIPTSNTTVPPTEKTTEKALVVEPEPIDDIGSIPNDVKIPEKPDAALIESVCGIPPVSVNEAVERIEKLESPPSTWAVKIETSIPTPVEAVAKIEQLKPDSTSVEASVKQETEGVVLNIDDGSNGENRNGIDESSWLNGKCQKQTEPMRPEKLPEKPSLECLASVIKPFSWSRIRSKWRSECMRKCETHAIQHDSVIDGSDSRIGEYFRRLRRSSESKSDQINQPKMDCESKSPSRRFRFTDECKSMFGRVKSSCESNRADETTTTTTIEYNYCRRFFQRLRHSLCCLDSSHCTSIRSECGHMRAGCGKCWCYGNRKKTTITEPERRSSNDSSADKHKWTYVFTNFPKLDSSFVEHGSIIKGAIPVLPVPLALICLILNVFLPGFGTFSSGMFCLFVGKPRFSINDSIVSRIGAFLVNLLVAGSQLFTVLFCLVGWGWSVWWGIIMIKMAKKNKRILAEQERNMSCKVATPNQNADPEIGFAT